jgi:hypothetical protein
MAHPLIQTSTNLISINLISIINNNHELNVLNISNLNSQKPISHSSTEKFSFYLSWEYQWMKFCEKR